MRWLPYILADLVVLVHFLFVVFAVLGGLLALRWPRIVWVHLPAVVWAVLVEAAGWFCPLTPLEQHFRRQAGLAPYEGGFVAHYLLPVLYPEGLTREIQWALAALVLAINLAVYGLLLHRWRERRRGRRLGRGRRAPETNAGGSGAADGGYGGGGPGVEGETPEDRDGA